MPAILKHSKVATQLSRDFPVRGGVHLIRYHINFQARCDSQMLGGGIIWAMDIFSIWKKGYMLCVYPQLLYSKWWKRIAVIRIHYFVCTVYLWALPPLPRLNKIFTAYIFLAPFRGVVQKYSPKKKNNVHTCTVYNVRKIKVYWKKKTKFLKVVEFSLEP